MIKRVFQDITNLQTKRIKVTIHKSSHRKKLLRWIYEVCKDFKYSEFTYIITVLIIDTYTEKNGFDLDEYQLIGITALFIGAKIEEPKTLLVSEYSTITDATFSDLDILKKEKTMLQTIDFNITAKPPQYYFNFDYFNNNFKDLSISEKKEILNCFIAVQLEQNMCTKNMFLLYLEAVREMENVLSSYLFSESIRFYIENNPRIGNKNIFNPKNITKM